MTFSVTPWSNESLLSVTTARTIRWIAPWKQVQSHLTKSVRDTVHCVYRCLSEAAQWNDTELVALCEGDVTFRAADLDKFLAYIPHAEIVNGTRIVEQLRDYDTQLSTFMYYGNFFVGKLLEAKHLGRGTFTDVGTT